MATVSSFLSAGACFEPAQLAAMCEAYDRASATLRLADKPDSAKETLAAEIIALASDGECDVAMLCEVTLRRMARWN